MITLVLALRTMAKGRHLLALSTAMWCWVTWACSVGGWEWRGAEMKMKGELSCGRGSGFCRLAGECNFGWSSRENLGI